MEAEVSFINKKMNKDKKKTLTISSSLKKRLINHQFQLMEKIFRRKKRLQELINLLIN